MKISVLGAGNVGGILGKAFASVGPDIFFGVPNPKEEKNKKLIDSIAPNRASVGSVSERFNDAVRSAELVDIVTNDSLV